MSRGPMPEAQAPAPPPGATREAEAPPAFSRKWWVLVTVMVGTFMGPFDGSVVNIALPRLTEYFGVGVTTVEWVVVAYLLTVSTFLLTFGRLGDMIGLKKIYLTGFAVFVLGSGACALAWNVWALVGFRVLQALGAGMLFAVGPAIVTHAFPPTERGKALGFVGVSVAVGLALGPTLGGFLIGIYDWHLIFLVNLPVGLFALVLAWRVLSYDEPHDQRFDPLGSVTSFVALFPLLLALSRGEAWGWGSPLVLGLFALSAAGAISFVVTELRVEQPVLDLGLFRIRLFSAATLSAMASYVVTSTVIFTIPFYLINIRGFPVQVAGLLLTPVPPHDRHLRAAFGKLVRPHRLSFPQHYRPAHQRGGRCFLGGTRAGHGYGGDRRPAALDRGGHGALPVTEHQRNHGLGTAPAPGHSFRNGGDGPQRGHGAGGFSCRHGDRRAGTRLSGAASG